MTHSDEQRSGRWIGLAIVLVASIVALTVVAKVWLLPMFNQWQVEATSTQQHFDHEVTYCDDTFSGYAVARSDRFVEELGRHEIGIKHETIVDYTERMKAIRSGKCTFAAVTIGVDLITGDALREFPGAIIMVIDESKGADGGVAFKTAVPNVDALNHPDTRIVLTPDSPSETLARHMKYGMLPELSGRNWIYEADGASDVLKQMRDADPSLRRVYMLWEPVLSQALQLPDTHLIYSSKETSGVILDVLVVNRAYLASEPDRVRFVLESYFRALNYYQSSPTGMVQLVMDDAQRAGNPLTAERAEWTVAGIQWANTLENYAYFGLLPVDQRQGIRTLDQIIDSVAHILVKTGKLDVHPAEGKTKELWFDRPLESMRVNHFHPGNGGDLDAIRGSGQLKELTPDEWDQLVVVGDLDARTIGFRRNNPELTPRGIRDIDEIADQLHTWPNYYITVVGTTPGGGDLTAERKLELERAENVVERLVYQGIDPNRLRALDATAAGVTIRSQSVRFELGQTRY